VSSSAAGDSVVITGAAGFLGQYVARHFVKAGWRVIGLDVLPDGNGLPASVRYECLTLPGAGWIKLLQTEQPKVVVHCAGCASVGLSLEDPAVDFRGNTWLVFELLDALRRHAPDCRFLLLSSAAVYGNPATLPVTEQHAVQPLSPYGYHKRQAELLCEEFSRIYGLPTVVARIFSAYGPGLRRQVVWDICARALTTGRLVLRGTGRESRDFIHAADIAQGLHLLASAGPCRGEIYNLACGCEVSIAELAAALLAALGSKVQLSFDGTITPGDPLHWRADIAKITALGFAPSVPLDHGLRAVAEWCAGEQLTA
jgi:UDP-glucose 4-epimerase